MEHDLRRRVSRTRPGRVVYRLKERLTFGSTSLYWERRYSRGGTSGPGSYGRQAGWKGQVVNHLVDELGITSAVELGCGDGNQLRYCDWPRYLGLDVSGAAVRRCMEAFGADDSKSFARYDPAAWWDAAGWFTADAAVSLEVIFHLVEDDVLERYLRTLFALGRRYVIVCSTDRDDVPAGAHERHRRWTPLVADLAPGWRELRRIDPPADVGLLAGFVVYGRADA
ncbi:MAG TPA: class I SAM-dependent methyltransferase [Jiangellales bacterium]|nr:class I SAM-dependent methyltransferase [Jiangellales bacterium]